MLLVLGLHLVAWETRYLVSVAGVIIGNSMSAAILAGRMFLRSVRERADEIQGWMALGARPSQAYAEVARTAVRETLVPTIDQTASTGMVTLPGAFVGRCSGSQSRPGGAVPAGGADRHHADPVHHGADRGARCLSQPGHPAGAVDADASDGVGRRLDDAAVTGTRRGEGGAPV